MSKKPIWNPVNIETGLTKYIGFLKKNGLCEFSNYENLHRWSVNEKSFFWKSIWDFTNIVGEYAGPVINNEEDFVNSKFFINSKLNYTKNILNINSGENAVVFYSERGHCRKITWRRT